MLQGVRHEIIQKPSSRGADLVASSVCDVAPGSVMLTEPDIYLFLFADT